MHLSIIYLLLVPESGYWANSVSRHPFPQPPVSPGFFGGPSLDRWPALPTSALFMNSSPIPKFPDSVLFREDVLLGLGVSLKYSFICLTTSLREVNSTPSPLCSVLVKCCDPCNGHLAVYQNLLGVIQEALSNASPNFSLTQAFVLATFRAAVFLAHKYSSATSLILPANKALLECFSLTASQLGCPPLVQRWSPQEAPSTL